MRKIFILFLVILGLGMQAQVIRPTVNAGMIQGVDTATIRAWIPWISSAGKTYLKNINDNVGIGSILPLHRLVIMTSKATNLNGFNIVQADWNKKRTTLAEATDTSSYKFNFTDGGKPLFQLKNNTGVSVMDLDSNNTFTLRGSAATNLPTYGSELLTSAGWTAGAGWTESPDDVFAHTSGGGTATLVHSATIANATLYQISWTITGRTTGEVTISVGGRSVASVTASGTFGPKTISTAAFTITPTDLFDGTISVTSLKAITALSKPIFAAYNTAGTGGIEIRANSATGGYASGYQAGGNVTTASNYTATGYRAGFSNTTGSGWTANGYQAGYSSTTGNYWTANGNAAGYSNTTGGNWTANGYYAGYSNTTGSGWTANGYRAGFSNTTGSGWTANGYLAGYSNTTGSGWTANGNAAGYSNTTGSGWTANGNQAGYSSTTGNYWTANGNQAGYSNTTGSYWTANGNAAGYSNTTGSEWTANGYQAGFSNTIGYSWTANGNQAGYSNTTGSYWTANGNQAGYSNTTGSYWTANGNQAGYSNTTGSYWTANGYKAGFSNTTGSYWTANGYQAARFLADGATEAQVFNNSTYIGANTKVSAESVTNENVFGYNATGSGSNTVTIGDANIIKTVLQSPLISGKDTTGVGSTANIGMIQYYDGHFFGLIDGVPPKWKQLDN